MCLGTEGDAAAFDSLIDSCMLAKGLVKKCPELEIDTSRPLGSGRALDAEGGLGRSYCAGRWDAIERDAEPWPEDGKP